MKNQNRFLNLLSVLNFFLLVWLGAYIGGIIRDGETIEDRLAYTKPEVTYQHVTQETTPLSNGQSAIKYTYVPAYSHIYANHGQPILLEATLSVRNADPSNDLKIHAIDYYSSSGELIKSYTKNEFLMPALTSVEYLSEKMNEEGGVGAFFVVLWSSNHKLAEPVIESVMINSSSKKQVSFTSRGVLIPYAFTSKKIDDVAN